MITIIDRYETIFEFDGMKYHVPFEDILDSQPDIEEEVIRGDVFVEEASRRPERYDVSDQQIIDFLSSHFNLWKVWE